jgi:hypothetical protein
LNGAARATVRARIPVKGEKYLALALNTDRQVIATKVGILTGQGGNITSFINGAGAIAHVHYKGLIQKPCCGDHSAVKFRGISSFVIGQRGRKVWEVGRTGGNYQYRSVHGSSPGRWRDY